MISIVLTNHDLCVVCVFPAEIYIIAIDLSSRGRRKSSSNNNCIAVRKTLTYGRESLAYQHLFRIFISQTMFRYHFSSVKDQISLSDRLECLDKWSLVNSITYWLLRHQTLDNTRFRLFTSKNDFERIFLQGKFCLQNNIWKKEFDAS